MNFLTRLQNITWYAGFLAIFLCVMSFSSVSRADISGDWLFSFTLNGTDYPNQKFTFVQDANNIITGSGSANGYTWLINGSTDGNTFYISAQYQEIAYYVFLQATLDGNGDLVGDWSDTTDQRGTFIGKRDVRRHTTMTIACERGPEVTNDYVCTASIAAEDGKTPAPAVELLWTAESGSFRYGNKCTTEVSATDPATARCGVTFIPPTGGITSEHPPLTAAFAGDTDFLPSSAAVTSTTIQVLPKKPKVCFDEEVGSCEGLSTDILTPTTTKKTFGNVTFSYFGPDGAGASGLAAPLMEAIEAHTSKLSPPKKKGDIAFTMQIVVNSKDNPSLKNVKPLKNLGNKISRGMIMAEIKGNVRFGQSKTASVRLNTNGRSFVSGANKGSVSNFNVRVVISTLRKGDKKPTNFTKKTQATVGQ